MRTSAHVLQPDDVVIVPERQPGSASCATGARHRFRRHRVPEKFRLQLMTEGKPRAEVEYRFVLDGTEVQGKTDGDGKLEQWIPPGAERARLVVGSDEAYDFQLGRLAPADTPAGIRARLVNLGFLTDAESDDDEYAVALAAFRHAQKLAADSDDTTLRDALLAVHGC